MYLKFLLLCLAIGINSYANAAIYSYPMGMKCSYGERGSLTATCENATANYFKTTNYRFDSLDETLVCRTCNLANLPSNVFDITGNQIETLILQRSNITGVSNAAFMGLVQLKYLDLSHNFIPSISAGVFKGVKNVHHVDLSYNNITVLLKNGFSELGNLTTLLLNNNLIKTIDTAPFNKLYNLKTLDLGNNFIRDLTDAFIGLKAIERLSIQNNSLQTVAAQQINMTTLLILDLSQNQIKYLSPNIFWDLKNLARLNLSRNGLEVIEPGAFKGLAKLEFIDLEHNNVKAFDPSTFIRLHNLRELHMPYNKLVLLQFAILAPMPELRYLNVSHNNINGIGRGNVLKLYNLHTLDISFNNITYLDYKDIFDHAQRLVFMNVDHNNLPCFIVEEMIEFFTEDNIILSIDDKYEHLQQTCNKTISKDTNLEAEMVKLEKLAKPEPQQTSGNIYVIYSLLCILAIIICFMGYMQLQIYRETIGRKTNDMAEVNLITSAGLENRDDY